MVWILQMSAGARQMILCAFVRPSVAPRPRFNASPACAAADRLEVGTESSPDRSKSIKTYLMPLFEAVGNHAVEVSMVARCYTALMVLCTDGIGQFDCRLTAISKRETT